MIAALLLCTSLGGWASASAACPQEIEWHHGDLQKAKVEATSRDKDILVYFWSDTSQACTDFYQNQMKAKRVIDATQAFLCFSAQLESPETRALFERYKVQTMPTMLVLDPSDESAQDGIIGSANIPTIVHHLERIARDEDTLRDFEERCKETPNDLDLRSQMANRHASLGNTEKAEELLASIRADDPEGKTAVAASMYLSDKVAEVFGSAPTLTEGLIDQLISYVEQIKPVNTKHAGWDRVATLQSAIGDFDGEFEAWRKAFPHVRDTQLFNWGWRNGLWWWSNRDVLSKEQKSFALEVARKTAAVSERLSKEDPGYYDPGLFLTRRLNMLAMVLHMNGEKDEATALMERCVKLYPVSGEYQARLAAYKEHREDANFSGYNDFDASWSPDGKKVVFTSTRDRNTELYVADIKKASLKRVTRSLSSDDQGAFSSKGKEVVFRSDRFKMNAIYASRVTGKDCELLVPLNDEMGHMVESGRPSYSKDGKSMALIRMDGTVPRAMVGNARGTNFVPLTKESEGEDSVAWAGRKLVYSSSRAGKKDIFIANPDGSDELNLTPKSDESWDTDVSASKDGKLVVFASWLDGRCAVWSVEADGSNLTQLTTGQTQDRRPHVSPDGKLIVFDRSHDGGSSRLWIMNADGSNARPLLGQG